MPGPSPSPTLAPERPSVDRYSRHALGVPVIERVRAIGSGLVRTPSALLLTVWGIACVFVLAIPGLVVIVSAGVVCFGLTINVCRRPLGWTSPLGAPLLYVTAVHTVPFMMAGRYVFAGQRATVANGVVAPYMATDQTMRALGLFLVGLLAGSQVLGVGPASERSLRAAFDRPVVDAGRSLRLVGRLSLAMAIGLQSIYFARNGIAREGTTALDAELTTMGRIFLFAGVVATAAAAGQRQGERRALRRWDSALTVLALVLATTWGSRSTLLAPILVIAFSLAVRRPGAGRRLIAGAAAGLVLFVFIAETRMGSSDESDGFGVATLVERSVRDINAPTYLTYYTLEAFETVPTAEPARGTSYLAAIPRMAPSALSQAAGWDLPLLGTTRYRELIGFRNPNRNFGFAAVAEGVINFGILGSFISGFGVGGLLGLSYRWLSTGASVLPRRWLYPIVFASVPWIVRSDALQAGKPILYAVGALGVAAWLGRSTAKAS